MPTGIGALSLSTQTHAPAPVTPPCHSERSKESKNSPCHRRPPDARRHSRERGKLEPGPQPTPYRQPSHAPSGPQPAAYSPNAATWQPNRKGDPTLSENCEKATCTDCHRRNAADRRIQSPRWIIPSVACPLTWMRNMAGPSRFPKGPPTPLSRGKRLQALPSMLGTCSRTC